MRLITKDCFDGFGAARRMGRKLELRLGLCLCLFWMVVGNLAGAQAVSTTTVQGTVYLANGQVGSGTLVLSWPAFTTANGQSVTADSTTVTIAADGFVGVNLAPNLGAAPAGLYYTAVYYLSDGTTTTQYWVVPAAAQASLAQVQAQLMPAAQAVPVTPTLSSMLSNLPMTGQTTWPSRPAQRCPQTPGFRQRSLPRRRPT
jgi:hypothetical protein